MNHGSWVRWQLPSSRKTVVVSAILLSFLTGCSTTPSSNTPIVTQASPPVLEEEAITQDSLPSNSIGSATAATLPADVETYYRTMIFIQGTAQLLAKLDIEGLTSNPAGFAPLVMIPGVMDDKVIAANALPVPSGLEDAWSKASTAEAGLTQALQDFLLSYAKEAFLQSVTSNEILAAEAVAEAEAVLAAQYGASADEIAAVNRAALTEMGETYQTFASFLAAGQTQSDDGSQ